MFFEIFIVTMSLDYGITLNELSISNASRQQVFDVSLATFGANLHLTLGPANLAQYCQHIFGLPTFFAFIYFPCQTDYLPFPHLIIGLLLVKNQSPIHIL